MCNSTARTSFMAARASTKLTESLLSVRNRIAKKQQQQQSLNVVSDEQQSTNDTIQQQQASSPVPSSSSSVQQQQQPPQQVVNNNATTVVQQPQQVVNSSNVVIQQQQNTAVPITSVATPANGYNLVEKKKRKVRCGKEAGPQDQFMFHLKLEQETKKKRKSRRKAANTTPVQQNTTTTTTATTATTIPAKPIEETKVHRVTQQQQQFQQQQQPQKQIHTVPAASTNTTPLNGVISSIIEAIAQDNNVVPTIVTMVDGCVLKANNALNKLLSGSNGSQVPSRTMIHNMLHPDDMTIHHIQLLKLLASNSDTSKYELRMVNADCRAIKVTLEVMCIRNDNALPQWLIIRVLSALELNEYVHPEAMNKQQCNCSHHEQMAGIHQDLVASNNLTLDELYLGVLERMLFNGPSAFFIDSTGSISWNNSAFDQLFGLSGRPFVGKNILEIAEIKGTPIELLSRAILTSDQQEKMEAQISPTNLPALGSKALKSYIQKISNTTEGTYGYLWLLSIIDEQARSESEQLTCKLMNECIDSQRQLQREYTIAQQQKLQHQMQPAHPIQQAATIVVDEMVQDSGSPVNFLMMNDMMCVNDEITRDAFSYSGMPSEDKRFDYIDSNIIMYPAMPTSVITSADQQHQDLSGWSSYDIPDQFFADEVTESEIDSIFSSL